MSIKVIGSNQTEVNTGRYSVLFSYNTPVAYWDSQTLKFYRTGKKWSVTTSKHINAWLDGRKAETVDQCVLDNLLD